MIPVYEPWLTDRERGLLMGAFDSGWISSRGAALDAFSAGLSEYLGCGVSGFSNNGGVSLVANGTVALHLALLACGVGSGDEVIVPSLTYIATANAVLYCGATPVFADSKGSDWNIDVSSLESKISNRTKAIIPVHLFGFPCNMPEILSVAKRYNLLVVEDAAESLGTVLHDRHLGTWGDFGTFSFFGNKTITTGEGGALYSSDLSKAILIDKLKSQGNSEVRFVHDVLGYNYRMTNIQAAIGVGQLERIGEIIREKRRIHARYREMLSPRFIWQESIDGADVNVWMNTVLVPHDVNRDALMGYLSSNGIESRPLFYPAHTMCYLSKYADDLPVAIDLAQRGISLPSSPTLGDDSIAGIARLMNNFKA